MTLDIGYTMLFNIVDAMLQIYGFDTYYGVFHRCFYMRKSLVCDIMEPMRPIIDYEIRKAIKSLRKKCTTIIIAHRISSAQDADHIIVLENGRITQNGNHQQLVNQPGLYKRIYEIQTAMKEGDINE